MSTLTLQTGVILMFCMATVAGYCIRPGHRCYYGVCTDRLTQEGCYDSVTCPVEKTCECFSSNYTGHDCWLPTNSQYYMYPCLNPCNKHGVCFYGTQCYCDFGYYGDNCEFKNDTATCDADFMYVNVTTDNYRSVFLNKNKRCEFHLNGDLVLYDVYSYSNMIPLEPIPGSECDGVRKVINGNFTTYSILVDVRDKEDQLGPFDYITEFTCTVEQKGFGKVKEIAKNEGASYGVLLLDEFKNPLRSNPRVPSVDKGLRFSIAFYPILTSGTFQVDVLNLRLMDEKTSRLMYDILVDGCPTAPGLQMMYTLPQKDMITLPDGNSQEATIVPFKPLNTAFELFIDYKIRLCDGRCDERECKSEAMHTSRNGLRLSIF